MGGTADPEVERDYVRKGRIRRITQMGESNVIIERGGRREQIPINKCRDDQDKNVEKSFLGKRFRVRANLSTVHSEIRHVSFAFR